MRKATQQIRVNTTRYLDEDGLDILWEKIKEYVAENSINLDGADIDLSNYTTEEELAAALEPYITEAEIDEILKDLPINIDLSNYVTKEELADATINVQFEDLTDEQKESLKGEPGEQGIQGEPGNPGVYIGAAEPLDEDMMVWIDTDDGEVSEFDNYYTKSEVDALIDTKLGVIENGSY